MPPADGSESTDRVRQPHYNTRRTHRSLGHRPPAVFKLIESAQARWRAVNAPYLVASVRAGARFERGHLVERPEGAAA
jgi:hypothetical protein